MPGNTHQTGQHIQSIGILLTRSLLYAIVSIATAHCVRSLHVLLHLFNNEKPYSLIRRRFFCKEGRSLPCFGANAEVRPTQSSESSRLNTDPESQRSRLFGWSLKWINIVRRATPMTSDVTYVYNACTFIYQELFHFISQTFPKT